MNVGILPQLTMERNSLRSSFRTGKKQMRQVFSIRKPQTTHQWGRGKILGLKGGRNVEVVTAGWLSHHAFHRRACCRIQLLLHSPGEIGLTSGDDRIPHRLCHEHWVACRGDASIHEHRVGSEFHR